MKTKLLINICLGEMDGSAHNNISCNRHQQKKLKRPLSNLIKNIKME